MRGNCDEALESLSRLRRLPRDDNRLVLEDMNIQAESLFNQEVSVVSAAERLDTLC